MSVEEDEDDDDTHLTATSDAKEKEEMAVPSNSNHSQDYKTRRTATGAPWMSMSLPFGGHFWHSNLAKSSGIRPQGGLRPEQGHLRRLHAADGADEEEIAQFRYSTTVDFATTRQTTATTACSKVVTVSGYPNFPGCLGAIDATRRGVAAVNYGRSGGEENGCRLRG